MATILFPDISKEIFPKKSTKKALLILSRTSCLPRRKRGGKRGYIDYLGFVLGVCFFGFILLIIVLGSVAWICDIWKDMHDKIKRHRREKKGQKQ